MAWNDREWQNLRTSNKADAKSMAMFGGMLQERVLRELERERTMYGEIVNRDEMAMQRLLQELIRDIKEIPASSHQSVIKQYLDDSFRFGPIDPLWQRKGVTDIQIFVPLNSSEPQVIRYVENGKRKYFQEASFRDYDHARDWLNQHLSRIGMRYDPAKIKLNGMLPGGERIHVIGGPVGYSIYQPLREEYRFVRCLIITIRRFAKAFSLEELTSTAMASTTNKVSIINVQDDLAKYKRHTVYTPHAGGIADAATMDYLRIAGRLGKNHLLSGGTGSGKTTVLNALTVIIADGEQLLVIEEAPEMRPQCEMQVIRLYEREGVFSQTDALKEALRMFPSRIYVSELRDHISYIFMQAIMSGHDGSGSTIHASSCQAAFDKTIELACSHPSAPRRETVSRIFAERLGFIIQMNADSGDRSMQEVCEVNNDGTLHTVSKYVSGVTPRGRKEGYFEFYGPGEAFLNEMLAAGIEIPLSWKWVKSA
ncbi:ATPase, T2SS/T4P/T4SS family [Cohnella sp. GCM10020058]|uniref:ATPase, T2SS/T4P/T4SS family n=1 Tax=Cohnella sp. GCM10020058 TaxID=3317330 RepID=UPI00363473F9